MDVIQRKLSASAVLFLLLFISFAANAQRESRTINDGWRFLQGDCPEAAQPSWDDSRWASVHLPHTWNTDAYVEKDYYRGRGWYRRVLDIPASWKDKQVFLKLHTTAPRPFDFSSEYQQTYLEHYLPVLESTPYVCGSSHWNFIDFSSAVRDESMPRINNKGLVRADRSPKDVYYYYQAMWRKDIPVLHIASRDWDVRCGIQDAPGAPVMLPVKVYTNLPEVELFIDGRSVGRKSVTNCHAVFEVPFEGTHPYLSATGTLGDKKVYDGLRVSFAPIPSHTADADWTSLELAVNVGSNCFFTSDESGLTWVPDRPYAEGGWGYIGGKEKSTQTEIHLTADGPLYQTMREGIEEYRFDVPAGRYEVELLFADPDGAAASPVYLLGKAEEGAEGQGNVFAVSIDGQTVEEALAPARDAGSFHAVKRRYAVRHEGGSLRVGFGTLRGKTYLSGIKLRKL